MATMSIRIDGELFENARDVGARSSRSATQQLQHWARIGMELESSPRVPHALIEAVLNGNASYDELDDIAQAAVRVHWEDEIERRRLSLDLAREFSERGVAWTEADAGGKVIHPGGPPNS